jgi:hypothetical protein
LMGSWVGGDEMVAVVEVEQAVDVGAVHPGHQLPRPSLRDAPGPRIPSGPGPRIGTTTGAAAAIDDILSITEAQARSAAEGTQSTPTALGAHASRMLCCNA